MKSGTLIFLCFFLFNSFLWGQQVSPSLTDSTLLKTIKKRPWVATAEILGTNIIINRFDANIRGVDWAKVSVASWKANLKAGLQTDYDYFTTNWLGHPFHGSIFYNAARSNGYNYWESIPFTLGGSFMWEYFAETEPPSKMDLLTTTIGGIYLGELTHRIGEIFMHKIKKPFPKHALTAVVDPMSQVNLLLVKESRQNKIDSGFNPLIKGQFAIGGTIPIGSANNNIWGTGAYMGVSLVYGDLFTKTKKAYKPFDYFTVNSWLNVNFKGADSIYFSLLSDAPLVVKHLNKNSVVSISQQYDYLTSNVYKIGSLGITADYSWQHQWKNSYLATSIKAGFIILGSSQSEVVKYIYDSTAKYFFRDYIFGNGFTAEAEVLFKTKNFGKITGNVNKWIIYADDTKGLENLLLVIVEYDYPIWRKLNIGVQGNYYLRKANYEYFPAFRQIKKDYFDFRALISLRF